MGGWRAMSESIQNPVGGAELHIPFGHFGGSGSDSDHGHDLLVGRKALRDHLIRYLIFGGKQIACLITGRRGMGKTSFVRYCLQEYEHYAFERFRRIPAGKSILDYVVVLTFSALLALASVALANVARAAMWPSDNLGSFAFGALVSLGTLIPFIFFLKYAFNINAQPCLGGIHRKLRFIDPIIFFIIGGADIVYSDMHRSTIVFVYLTIPTFFLIISRWAWGRKVVNGVLPFTLMGVLSHSVISIVMLCVAGDVVCAAVGVPCDVHIKTLAISIFIALAIILIHFHGGGWPAHQDLAPAMQVIRIKAIFLFVVGVQLVATAALPLPGNGEAREKITTRATWKITNSVGQLIPDIVVAYVKSHNNNAKACYDCKSDSNEKKKYINYRNGYLSISDGIFVLTISIFWCAIACFEVVLISRKFAPFGAVQAIGAEMHKAADNACKGRPYAMHDMAKWCRELERMTFAWQIYRAYAQPIVAWVNLGFDELDHRSVVHGMLVALRDQYRKKFTDWNSNQALAIRFAGGVVLCIATILISDTLFGLPSGAYSSKGVVCPNPSPIDRGRGGDRAGASQPPSQIGDTADNGNSRDRMGAVPVLLCSLNQKWLEARHREADIANAGDKVADEVRKIVDRGTPNIDGAVKAFRDVARAIDKELDRTDINHRALQDDISKAGKVGKRISEKEGKISEDISRIMSRIKAVEANVSDLKKSVEDTSKNSRSEMLEKAGSFKPAVDGYVASLTDYHSSYLSVLYFTVIPIEVRADSADISSFDGGILSVLGSRVENTVILSIKLYHVIIALALWGLARWFLMLIPLLPYRANLKRMDDLLDSLTGRTVRGQQGGAMWAPARWVYTALGNQQESRSIETQPTDSRAVEAAFSAILHECANSYWRLLGGRYLRLSIPAPEINFVFDELDKLWAKNSIELPGSLSGNGKKASSLGVGPYVSAMQTAERRRTQMTNRLLSDLKRVISDSPARFIFVGGRLLHDEWLADTHSRKPLLTSIFDSEIYVPSLLTDSSTAQHSRGERSRLDELIDLYLRQRYRVAIERGQLRASEISFGASHPLPWMPWRPEREMVFLDGEVGSAECMKVRRKSGGEVDCAWQRRILTDLRYYLTYRSAGSPKRLKEILANMMRPDGRGYGEASAQLADPANDIILLRPPVILRVQFVAEIYRHLTNEFERRLVHRDDKMALSAFYLTDYLFKFHRRAFRWQNIERMDEIAHIHRAPDIRELLGEIIDHFGSRYLHRVVNGMYSYRFRGEVAQEIEHISHYNEREMAAFNFTLDESQSMKMEYISAVQEGKGTLDIMSGLGELYEYDQDYDSASQCYQKAVIIADEELVRQYGASALSDILSRPAPSFGLLGEGKGGRPQIPLSWALIRLRLMLQIGMTFEQAGNLERAEGEYVAAYDLSRLFLDRYLSDERSCGQLALAVDSTWLAADGEGLKHASLLYQPLFALAWVAEKQWSDIDTSATAVEKGLADLRCRLPFVKERMLEPSSTSHRVSHSSFSLIVSDLHNKAGDLYYFKGRHVVGADEIESYINGGKTLVRINVDGVDRLGVQGYLLKAHYHYCMAMHELRRYICHRVISSRKKLHTSADDGAWPTLSGELYPAFIHRAAAGILNNMAENMLARTTLFGLVVNKPASGATGMVTRDTENISMSQEIRMWLSSDNANANSDLSKNRTWESCFGARHSIYLGRAWWWFGRWQEEKKDKANVLKFEGQRSNSDRLRVSLQITLVAAELRAEGGGYEDAAAELFMAANSACQYLWWIRMYGCPRFHKIVERRFKGVAGGNSCLAEDQRYLADIALHCLMQADKWLRLVRKDRSDRQDPTIVGGVIPPEAVTLACSLALVRTGTDGGMIVKLRNLLAGWGVSSPTNPSTEVAEFQQTLFDTLRMNRYPVLNRLHGLKVLMDSGLLSRELSLREFDGTCDSNANWLARLYDEFDALFQRFDAPHMFTHTQIGHSAALYAASLREAPYLQAKYPGAPTVESVQRDALLHLGRAEETFTLGRAHYETLRKLYYLYDDFNDRRMHYARSIEMAGWDITILFRDYLETLNAQEGGGNAA
jgi:hypothetical protein